MSEPWRRRIALVVGISEYSRSSKLRNAVADAQALKQLLLKDGGFQDEDVVFLPDPTRAELMTELASFGNKIKDLKGAGPDQGCLALFFYAGHGLIDNEGEHYLIARDWNRVSTIEWALETYGCELSRVLNLLASAYAGIVLIDACREMQQQLLPDTSSSSSNSSSRDSGWEAQVNGQRGWGGDAIGRGHHSQNLLVGHSCAPRRTASDGRTGHGTYTEILLQELCNPAHHHVIDALLEVNVRVYEQTKVTASPQQPRLDLSAKAGLFDNFRLERLSLQEAKHLTPSQCNIRDWLLQMCDPSKCMRMRESSVSLLQRHIDKHSDTDTALNSLADLEGVPLLLGVLRDNNISDKLRLTTCKILAPLAANLQHRELLAAKRAGSVLLEQFAREADRRSSREYQVAWEVLKWLRKSKVAKLNMLHHGGVTQLVECLASCCDGNKALRSPECVEYACLALQLLVALLSDHCYMDRYRRRLAAEQLQPKLDVTLKAVQAACHKDSLEDDPNGATLVTEAKKLSSFMKSTEKN